MSVSLFDQFASALTALEGVVHHAETLDQAVELCNGLVGNDNVARWDDEALKDVGSTTASAETAGYSVITADVGIATTGAIGFAHHQGRPRAVGVLPPKQLVFLAEEQLVGEVSDALSAAFRNPNVAPPSSLVFVAGPSRTSDIQQRSIRGMHAPKSLDVIEYRR